MSFHRFILATCFLAGCQTLFAVSSQTIAFDAIPNQIFGISPFVIAAEASSGLAVGFASNTPTVCKTVSVLVDLLKPGTCTIVASQPGNASYSAAPSVTRSFVVQQAKPATSFTPTAASPVAVAPVPNIAVVADFNKDGKLDLATANAANNVTVFLGDGAGGFAAGNTFELGVSSSFTCAGIAVGDFNADGFPDLAVTIDNPARTDLTTSTLVVLLGNSSGGFTPAKGSPFTGGTYAGQVVVGDFNGDGKQDIAVADTATPGEVTVLLGNGQGGFTEAVAEGSPFTVESDPESLAVGVFNQHGFQDLVTANFGADNVTVLLGNGRGGFTEAGSPIKVGKAPASIAVGDFDRNGNQDLAVVNLLDSTVTVLLGNGSGGFTEAVAEGSPFQASPFPGGAQFAAVGDFNGDGLQDLALAGDTNVTVLLGDGTGRFKQAPASPFAVGALPQNVVVGDFDGDGIEDFATVSPISSDVAPFDYVFGSIMVERGFVAGSTPQTIAFGPLGSVVYGGSPVNIGATASSGLPVLFASNSTSVCTVLGATVTIENAGICMIVARQAGSAKYAAAPDVSQSFTVNPASQTIDFAPLSNLSFGSTPPPLSATASSGLGVTFTSNSPSVCTVSGATITVVAGGLCSITANAAASANYTAAPAVTRTFTIEKIAQQLTFHAIPSQIFGISPFPITAKTSSDLAVHFASTTPTVCKIASGLVELLKPGTCTVVASQAGNGAYSAATAVTRSFTVLQAKPSTSFSWTTGSPIQLGTDIGSMITADFNGDGKPDLATANFQSHEITVLLGDGAGGFTHASGSPFAVGAPAGFLAAGDFNGDGIPDLAVSTGDYNQRQIIVLLGNGAGSFTAAAGSPFAVAAGPAGIAVGDFNGDGIEDLATTDYFNDTVTVLLGNGLGSFTEAAGSPFAVGLAPLGIAVGDFNGDGIQDLATANQAGGNITVLLGNGSGAFKQAPGSPFAVGSSPVTVAVGDFNRDSRPDLVLTDPVAGTVTVLLGNGFGGFTNAKGSPYSVGKADSVTVGDFNGDGVQDLASSDYAGGAVRVLLGDGAGGFTPAIASPFAVQLYPGTVIVGDFNGDGIEDIATASDLSVNAGSIVVELGFVAGSTAQTITFGPLSNVTYGVPPFTIGATASSGLTVFFTSTNYRVCMVSGTTVTITGGGTCTIVASQVGSTKYAAAPTIQRSFTVNPASQTISFALPANLSLAGAPPLIATATSGLPVNLTSTTPLVCTVSGVTLKLIATGTCSITASQPGNASYAAAAAVTRTSTVTMGMQHIEFDAMPDQILGISPFQIGAQATSGLPATIVSTTPLVCRTASGLVMLLSAGTCSIKASQPGSAIYTAATAVTRSFKVSLANPSKAFVQAPGSPFPIGGGQSAAVGDFNGDGIPDLATVSPDSNHVRVALGNGAGGFKSAAGSPFTVGLGPRTVVVGDFNGDGFQDVATANSYGNNVTVMLGDGAGGFTEVPGSPFAVGNSPVSLAVGDFNGDGIQDLAVTNFVAGTLDVLMGNGAGGFTEAYGSPFAVGDNPESVAVGDFDQDGIQDLAVANFGGNNVAVLKGDGKGRFTSVPGSPFAAGTAPFSVVVGDFHFKKDGKHSQDLAVANLSSNDVTVLLGDGKGGFTPAPKSPFAVGPTRTGPVSVAVGDFNGDGVQDLVTANTISNNVTVLTGDGQGGFAVTGGIAFPVGSGPFAVVVGDFNGDGIPDLATEDNNDGAVSVLLGTVPGTTAQTITFGKLNSVVYSAPPFAINATATSGLPVKFGSTTPMVCTVAGNEVTLVGKGTCSITASQAGNATYAAAKSVTQTFQVGVSAGPPAVVSLTPNAGAGTSVTFKAVYSDPNGAGDLSEVLLQVNTIQTSANACFVYYQPLGNHLYLYNNTGTALMMPTLTPGVAGTASNSQCTLNAGSSSVTTSGNTLTLSVALSFIGTFVDSRNVYLYAAGFSGQNSGWIKEGTWTPNPVATPPAIVSLSPASGTGDSVTFKAVYSDPNGAGDLSEVFLQVNSVQTSANGCYVFYQPQGNRLYLANNAGAWITPALTPGVTGTVSNSQCTLNAGLSSVTTAGNNLTLNVTLTFNGTFVGGKNVYLYDAGYSGLKSGWVTKGTWTP